MRAAPPQKAAGYGSISLVQLKGKDSDWMGMTNKYGEAWEVPVTPQLPWDIRIVGTDGQEVGACSGFQGAGIRVFGSGLAHRLPDCVTQWSLHAQQLCRGRVLQ